MKTQYSIHDGMPVKTKLVELRNLEPRRCTRGGMFEYDIEEEWFFDTLLETPKLYDSYDVQSIYHLEADELEYDEDLRSATYQFQSATEWREEGLQCLNRTS